MQSAKNRINAFWDWFTGMNAQIESLLNGGKTEEAMTLVAGKFDELCLPQQLLIGKSSAGKYELTFTPEENPTVKQLSRAWREAAPEKLSDKWNFLTFKRAADKRYDIRFNGKNYPADELIFGYEIESGKFNLDVFSKVFKKVTDENALQVTYILLDNLFGEEVVEQRFGTITPVCKKSKITKKKCSYKKLKKLVQNCEKKFNLNPLGDPFDSWFSYKMKAEPVPELRKDILAGMTTVKETVFSPDKIAKEAASCGASFCGFAINCEGKEQSEALSVQEAFVEKLGKFLKERDLGYVIGFASGTKYMYADAFVLDDGELAACLSDIKAFADTDVEIYFL